MTKIGRCLRSARAASSPFTLQHGAKTSAAHPPEQERRRLKLRARRVDDEEKESVWPVCVEHYPSFADYRARPARNIPVYVCEP